jgi:DNA-directed RNA polymerase specialized sigma24 family protein
MVSSGMGDTRRLSQVELNGLDDNELIDYAVRHREAGNRDEADLALQIFAFGMEGLLRAFVRNNLDSHGDAVIEEVAERALEDAIRSIVDLRGSTSAEARAFVFRIAKLRIVDFHRKGRVVTTPLEILTLEGASGPMPCAPGSEGEDDFITTRLVVDEALAKLRLDHRAVVELYVLSGFSAEETASMVRCRFEGQGDDSMSEQNVHQIGRRFRVDLRARLEQAEKGVVGR